MSSSSATVRDGEQAHPLRQAQRGRRFKTLRTVFALILREMQTTYGKSPGGYAWAFLEPVGGIALFTFILTYGFDMRRPALGASLPLFIASGLLVLTMFLAITNKVAESLQFSRPLLFYPGVRFTDALIARFALNVLTQMLVFYIVLAGIRLIYEVELILRVSQIVLALGLVAFLALGIGTMNCFLFSILPVWQNVWRILTRPLVLISTIFFTFEDVPQQYQEYAWYNPIVHIIGIMRRGFYPTYAADWASAYYVSLVAGSMLVFGLVFLYGFHRRILEA